MCGRRVGVHDEEHLDPFGDDDADLRSALEWTLPRVEWFAESASKRFKEEGVWYEALDPAVIMAVRGYWYARMTRKVRHHTVEGVVEGIRAEPRDPRHVGGVADGVHREAIVRERLKTW